jgi:arginine-tRNA-protein transferase
MTIVEDHGVYASTCGYCKSTKATFKSHGMSAHACSVEDYQHLIDRGWRRSGNWMYQPVLDDTCCPPYTVRLDVNEFTPTKSQKKVERRFTAYLEGRIDERGAPISREGDVKAPPGRTDGGGRRSRDDRAGGHARGGQVRHERLALPRRRRGRVHR